MHHIAVRVAEDLHLNMASALDEPFKIDFILAEGCLGFAPGLGDFAGKVAFRAYRAHAAAAAAP